MRRRGLRASAEAFLEYAADQKLDGFWIHLDVDVLDNALMPAVDSPQPGGLSYAELAELLLPLLQSPLAAGLDITILDPTLDPDGKITRNFVAGLQPLIAGLTA
ncbi:arginase family protein [Hymenobacter cellulosilyticus]|uniref:arginase family protein n=1 Tax=Hymenobacter cellulosilyticus TaxID=2932248 RepID=UPI0021D42F13|nr:arginase family protein [Hymenobacter cellulosilyticus]